jgi:hypothetical protein
MFHQKNLNLNLCKFKFKFDVAKDDVYQFYDDSVYHYSLLLLLLTSDSMTKKHANL